MVNGILTTTFGPSNLFFELGHLETVKTSEIEIVNIQTCCETDFRTKRNNQKSSVLNVRKKHLCTNQDKKNLKNILNL